MNPALFSLIRLQIFGFLRRATRGARSPRRAIFLVIGLSMCALWLASVSISAMAAGQRRHHRPGASERLREVAPLALLGICLVSIVSSAGDKYVAFTPGEVDMLFPGPFSRRELLAFKLLKSALFGLFLALVLSFALLPYARFWFAGYVGIFLSLLFIQLFSTAVVVLGQSLTRRLHSLFQRAVLIAALVVAVFVLRNMIVSRGGMHALYAFRDSDLGRNLLAPLDPFGRTITAFNASELLKSGGEAALVDLGLLVVLVLLDANYLEAATGASQRRYAQIQRIRSGSLLSGGVKGNIRWRLPRLPWLAGAGPIIWRQATSAARSARGLLLLLAIFAIGIGPVFGSAIRDTQLTRWLVGIVAWMTVLLSGLLKFDFRGDLDHMEELKAMPLRPAALAVGQIIVPTLMLTGAHLLLLGSLMLATPAHHAFLAVAAALALPFNALLMSTENVIFLMFPSRPAAASPGDFQMMGRQLIQLLLKGCSVMTGLVIAFAIALPVFKLMGGPLVVLTMIAGGVLLGESCALVPLMAWAFGRFDPSVDTPA
jgi:hypothetical protein